MSFAEFQASLAPGAAAPAGLTLPLQALWYDARSDWERAHECAQADTGRDGAWVHAYLHRKEGDVGNASYWYTRAQHRVPAPGFSFEAEWTAIAETLLVAPAGYE